MVLNTLAVSAAVTPTVIDTYISHYLHRKPLKQKPTAHIPYHEGLRLIRQFLAYASHHTVEELQAFTSQWVPSPRWVKVDHVTIPEEIITKAAEALRGQLGNHGIDRIGGEKWWQWRRSKLEAEWIEMRRDYTRRKQTGANPNRVLLYVHGGAYFFGSVDEHRYQMQRHARKLEARVLARLAPQFPFPCGLHDCLSAYLYLLTVQSPSEIVLAGDSAGAGMIVSVLIILRDQGLPLPAGAILISPWVDLTHSFPSVAGDSSLDYIPDHGFMQRPSASWPPPNTDDMEQIAMKAVKEFVDEGLPRKSTQQERKKAEDEAVQGFAVGSTMSKQNGNQNASTDGAAKKPGATVPTSGHDLSIMLDDKLVSIKDQIQMYTTNQLLAHPLVSPVIQTSLGGLPPLLIMVGGGEVLRDEQIYLAHKAANPSKYPPGDAFLEDEPDPKATLNRYKSTDVQLQVWDDLCHVGPALSFTRPAKFMYRSIAQFGAWALAKAQKTDIEIQDDDDMSIISSGSDTDSDSDHQKPSQTKTTMVDGVAQGGTMANDQVGKAGDPLPPFKNHIIRQRVDRHGHIFPLDPPSSLPALNVKPNDIGVIKAGPVRKWLNAKVEWDKRYAREKRRVQKERAKEMAKGYQSFGNDEVPPPSALAGRRGLSMPKMEKKKRSWGMSLWSLWGSSHDENTIEREEKAEKEVEKAAVSESTAGGADSKPARPTTSRSKSRRRTVTYTGQNDVNQDTGAADSGKNKEGANVPKHGGLPPTITTPSESSNGLLQTDGQARPSKGGKAFPFKLGTQLRDDGRNASTVTLMSQAPVATPKGDEKGKQLGEGMNFGATEGRRMTMQDDEGVLHKGHPPKLPEKEATQQQTTKVRDTDTVEQPGPAEDFSVVAGNGLDRRMTTQDDSGVLHEGPAPSAPPPLKPAEPDTKADRHEPATTTNPASTGVDAERRMTIQDPDGVIHEGAAPAPPSRPTQEIQDQDGNAERNTTPTAASPDPLTGGLERRMTVQDTDGVIHEASVATKGEQKAEKPERPGIERFETASEGL